MKTPRFGCTALGKILVNVRTRKRSSLNGLAFSRPERGKKRIPRNKGFQVTHRGCSVGERLMILMWEFKTLKYVCSENLSTVTPTRSESSRGTGPWAPPRRKDSSPVDAFP